MSEQPVILDAETWARRDRGRELQFFATDEEVQGWLETALPVDYQPYHLIAAPLIKVGATYVEEPLCLQVSDLLATLQQGQAKEFNYWVWSESLTPGLRLLQRGDKVGALCALNGLVLLQHGLRVAPDGARDSSRIAIAYRVVNLYTGEERGHDSYLRIYKALHRTISKALVYATIRRLGDGREEEDGRLVRWTEGAKRAYEAGVAFRARPGQRLERRN